MIIKICRYCGRKMKAESESQSEYNLKKHEDSCSFKKGEKEK